MNSSVHWFFIYLYIETKKKRNSIKRETKTLLIAKVKDSADILMCELRMGRGPTKGEQDQAWDEFEKYAKEIGKEWENKRKMRGMYPFFLVILWNKV